jgi:hypothetical protein
MSWAAMFQHPRCSCNWQADMQRSFVHPCNKTCDLFQKLSSCAALAIFDAGQLGLLYQEETISENLLLSLAKNCQNVKIKSFKRHEETKNGSDWEWWIKRHPKWLHMRVQAKKMRASGAVFQKLITQKPNPASPTQICTLINKAAADNALPAYCFYVGDNSNTWSAPPPAGCFIAKAKDIKKLNSNRWTEIQEISEPWHVLVCTCSNSIRSKSAHPNFFDTEEVMLYMKDEVPKYLTDWNIDEMHSHAKERKLTGFIKIEIDI